MAYIRKYKDIGEVNKAEKALIEACKAGDVCKLGNGELPKADDKSRQIRAELLRFLILGGCDECVVREGVKLTGAHVTGWLDLSFQSAKGTIGLFNCTLVHPLVLMHAKCDFLNLNGSHLPSLTADGIVVKGSVFLSNGFQAKGEVNLSGAEISGQLNCEKSSFENPEGDALNAQKLNVLQGFFWREVKIPQGSVNLTSAHTGDLADDLPSWPEQGRLVLDGFTYDRIHGSTDAASRLEWLSRGTTWNGQFFPQPYVQLAKVLREMGHERDARDVLLELNRLSRKHDRKRAVLEPDGAKKTGVRWALSLATNILRWLWDIAQRASIGYGLKPWRSLYVLAVLFTITATVAHYSWQEGSFAPNSGPILASKAWQDLATNPDIANPAERWSAKGGPGQDWESFNTFAYAADVVIPIIEFGQTPAWAPSTERGPWGRQLWWLRWVMSTLGWIVTALAAAAVTGIIKRD
ncbi:MAG: hypothetical protein GXP03_04495 [Alphaproteobacteria bacterium]|nr:hypothetical protein [Alphaproteobacteria bacterium]